MKLFKKSVSKNNEITIEGPGCGCLIIGVVLSIILSIVFFFEFGISSILGVEYDNRSAIFMFFICYIILDCIIDFIVDTLTKLFNMLNIANKTICDIFYIFLDVAKTLISIVFLDYLFYGIKISFLTAFLCALVLGIAGHFLRKKFDY